MKDDLPALPPAPPSHLHYALAGALRWAAVGAAIGLLFRWVFPGTRLGNAPLVGAALDMGVVGAVVGLTEAAGAEKLHHVAVENAILRHEQQRSLPSAMAQVERVVASDAPHPSSDLTA